MTAEKAKDQLALRVFSAYVNTKAAGGAQADTPGGQPQAPVLQAAAAPAGSAFVAANGPAPAPKAGPPPAAASGSPPDKTTKLLAELDRLEKKLAEYKKKVAGKPISKDDQKKLDAIQAQIDGVIKQIQAAGEVIAVDAAGRPPSRPSNGDGEIQYEGIPLDKLKDQRQKNIARENARNVRNGIKSVDAWAKELDEKTREHTEKAAKYDMVMAHSEDVNAAFSKDLQTGGFKKLSAAAPMFGQKLLDYQKAASDVKINLLAMKEQAFRIAAAQAMVEQAQMLLDAYNTEKERGDESQKLDELKQKLQGLKDGVNFVIDAAKDPKGAAKDIAKKVGLKLKDALVDEIVDGLLGGEKLKGEMAKIEARIAALDKRLEELKLGGLNAGVRHGFSTVQAEMEKTKQVQEAMAKAKNEQREAVNMLADMERDHPNTTTMFSQLQTHYGEVKQAGDAAMAESKAYENELYAVDHGMSGTARIRQTVKTDRAAMTDSLLKSGPDEEYLKHQSDSEGILDYADRMDEWYKSKHVDKEVQGQKARQEYLRDNKQFDYIGEMVKQVQSQGLGHV
jgi:hypothetical protein